MESALDVRATVDTEIRIKKPDSAHRRTFAVTTSTSKQGKARVFKKEIRMKADLLRFGFLVLACALLAATFSTIATRNVKAAVATLFRDVDSPDRAPFPGNCIAVAVPFPDTPRCAITVPAGQRLVVDFASAEAEFNLGGLVAVAVDYTSNGSSARHYFTAVSAGVAQGGFLISTF
jgi:hypothetical protein